MSPLVHEAFPDILRPALLSECTMQHYAWVLQGIKHPRAILTPSL